MDFNEEMECGILDEAERRFKRCEAPAAHHVSDLMDDLISEVQAEAVAAVIGLIKKEIPKAPDAQSIKAGLICVCCEKSIVGVTSTAIRDDRDGLLFGARFCDECKAHNEEIKGIVDEGRVPVVNYVGEKVTCPGGPWDANRGGIDGVKFDMCITCGRFREAHTNAEA